MPGCTVLKFVALPALPISNFLIPRLARSHSPANTAAKKANATPRPTPTPTVVPTGTFPAQSLLSKLVEGDEVAPGAAVLGATLLLGPTLLLEVLLLVVALLESEVDAFSELFARLYIDPAGQSNNVCDPQNIIHLVTRRPESSRLAKRSSPSSQLKGHNVSWLVRLRKDP